MWTWWPPPIGVFIGFAGVVGVLIPLLWDPTRMSGRTKSIFTAVFFILLGFEIWNDYRDRREHDERDRAFIDAQDAGFQRSLEKVTES
jgi:hypothetical protein